MNEPELIRNDPWLGPYRSAIERRMQKAAEHRHAMHDATLDHLAIWPSWEANSRTKLHDRNRFTHGRQWANPWRWLRARVPAVRTGLR